MKDQKRRTFTLAEVLITIGVIGIVAALVIPGFISKINARVVANRRSVIENRFLQSLNSYNTLEHGLSKPYRDTKEFLDGLQKYYKMVQICNTNGIKNCFPYTEIIDADITLKIDDISEPKDIGLKNEAYLSPAAFVSSSGTPFIIALKKDCVTDSEKALKRITDNNCIALLYDENGANLPNKVLEDIVEIGGINIKGYLMDFNGIRIAEPAVVPEPLNNSQCLSEVEKNYGITVCPPGKDSWAGAMKYCHDNGSHLSTREELKKIAEGLFVNSNGRHPNFPDSGGINTFVGGYSFDIENAVKMGITLRNGQSLYNTTWSAAKPYSSSSFINSFWSSYENGSEWADRRNISFAGSETYFRSADYHRWVTDYFAICVSNNKD